MQVGLACLDKLHAIKKREIACYKTLQLTDGCGPLHCGWWPCTPEKGDTWPNEACRLLRLPMVRLASGCLLLAYIDVDWRSQHLLLAWLIYLAHPVLWFGVSGALGHDYKTMDNWELWICPHDNVSPVFVCVLPNCFLLSCPRPFVSARSQVFFCFFDSPRPDFSPTRARSCATIDRQWSMSMNPFIPPDTPPSLSPRYSSFPVCV